jgi:hypothetical protein
LVPDAGQGSRGQSGEARVVERRAADARDRANFGAAPRDDCEENMTYGEAEELGKQFGLTAIEVINAVYQEVAKSFDPRPDRSFAMHEYMKETLEIPLTPRMMIDVPRSTRPLTLPPEPDAFADVIECMRHFNDDLKHAKHMLNPLEYEPSIEACLAILQNGKWWCEFWAVRYYDPERREWFKREAEEYAAKLRHIAELAEALLAKRKRRT